MASAKELSQLYAERVFDSVDKNGLGDANQKYAFLMSGTLVENAVMGNLTIPEYSEHEARKSDRASDLFDAALDYVYRAGMAGKTGDIDHFVPEKDYNLGKFSQSSDVHSAINCLEDALTRTEYATSADERLVEDIHFVKDNLKQIISAYAGVEFEEGDTAYNCRQYAIAKTINILVDPYEKGKDYGVDSIKKTIDASSEFFSYLVKIGSTEFQGKRVMNDDKELKDPVIALKDYADSKEISINFKIDGKDYCLNTDVLKLGDAPLLTGRPNRDGKIRKDDELNLEIALNLLDGSDKAFKEFLDQH